MRTSAKCGPPSARQTAAVAPWPDAWTPEPDDDTTSWLLPFSDLMSLLLIFFLIWSTMRLSGSTAPAPSPAPPPPPAQGPIEDIRALLLPQTPVLVHQDSVVIVLQERLSFQSAKADLLPMADATLQHLAPLLRRETDYDITIMGHTDDIPLQGGAWASNVELSLARATAVWSRLTDLGIRPGRLTIQGLGPLYPMVPNDTEVHRETNRRVELVLRPRRRAPAASEEGGDRWGR